MRTYRKAECQYCHQQKFIAAHSLCRACYARERRNGECDPKPKRVRATCSESNCTRPVVSYGKCDTHRIRYKRKTEARAKSITDSPEVAAAKFRKNKDSDLRKVFGITLQQYEAMMEQQGGVCAICGQTDKRVHRATGKPMMLAVDHCHDTQKVRALLCGPCNHGIGNFNHDPAVMRKAIAYLEQHA